VHRFPGSTTENTTGNTTTPPAAAAAVAHPTEPDSKPSAPAGEKPVQNPLELDFISFAGKEVEESAEAFPSSDGEKRRSGSVSDDSSGGSGSGSGSDSGSSDSSEEEEEEEEEEDQASVAIQMKVKASLRRAEFNDLDDIFHAMAAPAVGEGEGEHYGGVKDKRNEHQQRAWDAVLGKLADSKRKAPPPPPSTADHVLGYVCRVHSWDVSPSADMTIIFVDCQDLASVASVTGDCLWSCIPWSCIPWSCTPWSCILFTLVLYTLVLYTLVVYTLVLYTLVLYTLVLYTLVLYTLVLYTLILYTVYLGLVYLGLVFLGLVYFALVYLALVYLALECCNCLWPLLWLAATAVVLSVIGGG
jgi:hypothetical protein